MAGWVTSTTPVPTLAAAPHLGRERAAHLSSPARAPSPTASTSGTAPTRCRSAPLGAGATGFTDLLNVKSRTTYFYFLEAVDSTGAARSAWMSVIAPGSHWFTCTILAGGKPLKYVLLAAE